MIKIKKREIEPRGLEVCNCCGEQLMPNEELYLLQIGTEDFLTKDFRSGYQEIRLCRSCLIKIKDTITKEIG